MTTLQKIFTSTIAILFIGGLAANGYLLYKIRQFEPVINAQGSAIRLIVETPEINAVIVQELQRRQASSTPQK